MQDLPTIVCGKEQFAAFIWSRLSNSGTFSHRRQAGQPGSRRAGIAGGPTAAQRHILRAVAPALVHGVAPAAAQVPLCACLLPAYGHMACTDCTARLHGDRLPATRWLICQLLMRFEQRQTKIASSYE